MTNASRTAVRWLATGAMLVTVVTATEWAARPSAQSSSTATKLSGIDRLAAWIAAVKRHEPGAFDDAAEEVGQWDAGELELIWVDVSSLVTLVHEPRASALYAPRKRQISGEPLGGEPLRLRYTADELRQLRTVAMSLGGPDEGRDSRLLKRGAMLHADIARLAPQETRATSRDGPMRYRLRTDDGRPLDVYASVSHWEMGRRLLDLVRSQEKPGGRFRGPEHDEGVRLWYLAAMSHMILTNDLDVVQFETASQMFPRDPEVLFMCASFHEEFASADRQAALRSANLPSRVTFGVGSRAEQLARAEQLYRRALETAPASFDEARIRYARVLGQRGRHPAAVAELQKVGSVEPLLQYYAALFLGGELEALGRDDEAERAYERAVDVFPAAQSPRLALSRLATGAERGDAREALLTLLSQPRGGDVRDHPYDPLWIYESAPGRGTDLAFERLHQLLAREGL